MNKKPSPISPLDNQALALFDAFATLMRHFKMVPASGAFADMHVNDVSLLCMLAGPGEWTVRGLAQRLSAPDSTVSSALDRLEKRSLVTRQRRTSDRRVMRVELTKQGLALAGEVRSTRLEICRGMLAPLAPRERNELLRLVSIASGSDAGKTNID